MEYGPDGSLVERVQKDKFSVVVGDESVLVKGNVNITIEGNANVLVKGTYKVESEGNMTFKAPRIDLNP